MITIHELLEDSQYKKFFLTQPKLPEVVTRTCDRIPPWRLWVMLKKDHKWRKKDFATYSESFNYLKKLLKRNKVADASITSKRVAFSPPVRLAKIKGKYIKGSDGVMRQATTYVEWKPKLPADEMDGHQWCPYCRRSTAFKYFTKHHASPGGYIDPSIPRCSICGISARGAGYKRVV